MLARYHYDDVRGILGSIEGETHEPHCQPALECPENTRLGSGIHIKRDIVWVQIAHLVRSTVDGASGTQTAFQVVRVMAVPVPRQDF